MKLKLGGKTLLLTLGSLVVVGGAVGYYFWGRKATAEEYLTAKIERGNIRQSVSATGTLQAVTTVQVGSQVSGIISALYVDFNSTVKKGQVVAQLDPAIFQAQVAQQRANVEQARASLADAEARVIAAESTITNQRAGVSSATANLEALKAQRDDAKNNLQRMESLAASGLINQREQESARASFQAAEARYNQAAAQLQQARASEQQAARAGLAQAQAAVKQAKAQVQQTEAALKLAEVNLSHTTISSPIDGVVVSRNVDVGQTVAASLQAPTLFTIANDLTQMQVIANIDQADIGVINSTNRINFTVDAFPGQNFNGTISQIRLNPQNVQNVVTYNVVIDVENPELKLKPGMTANLTVTIAERQNVVRVPNAALRFRPADVTQEKLREIMRAGRPEGQQGQQGQGQQAGQQGQPQADAKPAAEPQRGDKAAGEKGREGGREGRQKPGDQQQANAGGNEQRRPGQPGQQGQGGQPGQGQGGGQRSGGTMSGFVPTAAIVQGQTRLVWVMGPDGKPQPRRIKLGITDGVNTEVVEGELKEGEMVITAQNSANASRTQSGTGQRAPGFGGAPGGGPGGGGRMR